MKYIIEYDIMDKKKIVEIEADDPRKAKYVAYKTLVKDGIFDNKLRFMNFLRYFYRKIWTESEWIMHINDFQND